MGFLDKLIGGKESQFQKRALEILKRSHPNESFRQGSSALKVMLGAVELDLQRLYSNCRNNETQTEELVLQYFSHAIALSRRPASINWETARPLLRPQLVPLEFQDRLPVWTYPFSEKIGIGIVLKESDGAPFVRAEQLAEWGIPAEGMYKQSVENLSGDKAEKEVTITDGSDRFIGMETHDGFDAVRILLPSLRQLAAEKLGERYYAGIPNRNFLILWSRECSPRFRDYAVEKIETDFAIQPFPLASNVFEVSSTGIKPL